MTPLRSGIVWAILGPILVLGFIIGRYTVATSSQLGVSVVRERDPRYKYIQKLLGCSLDSTRAASLQKLHDQVSDIIAQEKRAGLTNAGFYFRSVNTGAWTGVNEDARFTPASLLKVDVMIAAYKLAESDPGFLQRPVKFAIGRDLNQEEVFKPVSQLKAGSTYTIGDLITAMIVHSDNNAMAVLDAMIGPATLQKTFDDLQLRIHQEDGAQKSTSPQSYSLTLRVLYNATYLSREMSNQALALLSRADFNYGIKQAIPSSIEVAEKFGERSVIDSRSGRVFSRELHDCGLVYYPDHPYLLCVMTEGPDFNELLATIREISAAAYNFVDGTPFRTSCATQSLPEH